MKKRKLHYAWIILLGVILIRGFASGGINMTSGLFLEPVSEDIGVGIGTISLYLSIMSVVTVIFLPIAGKIINKYDIRIISIIGAFLQALSFVAFGFLKSVFGWYILAIPQAIGAIFIATLMGPILINRWFVKNKGLIMGIQMAFVGLFGAVLEPVTAKLISRNGWRYAYFIIGSITFVVVVIASILFIRNRPSDKKLSALGEGERTEAKKQVSDDVVHIPESIVLKSASFYLLLFFMIAITGVGVFNQHIPTYGELLGFSINQTGEALSSSSIGTAIGSVAIGFISDRIGSLKTCYIMIGAGLAAVVAFLFGGSGIVIFFIASFLHGFASAGIMVLAPILTLSFYGNKDYEKIFSKISMGAPIASILLIPFYGFIYDYTHSYFLVLLIIAFLLIFSTISISLGWKKRCTLMDAQQGEKNDIK